MSSVFGPTAKAVGLSVNSLHVCVSALCYGNISFKYVQEVYHIFLNVSTFLFGVEFVGNCHFI